MRYRSPSIAPGGNAPRSSEPEDTSRPTEDAGLDGTGLGAEPISVGRCDSDAEMAEPHAGQKRPSSGTSELQRWQRDVMRRC